MQTYICEICGEAHLGTEAPKNCPFCGARLAFIKKAVDAKPVVLVQDELSEVSRKNLLETLKLEMDATAIYSCMSSKSKEYELQVMFRRLACVEYVHALTCYKLLGMEIGKLGEATCSDIDMDNFHQTFDLEDRATKMYMEFAKTSTERHVKIFFAGLMQAEADHIELINGYLKGDK